MNIHDATEIAYKNGYEKGYQQGIEDFAERIKKYYNCLHGKTSSAVVAYHINQIEEELFNKLGVKWK